MTLSARNAAHGCMSILVRSFLLLHIFSLSFLKNHIIHRKTVVRISPHHIFSGGVAQYPTVSVPLTKKTTKAMPSWHINLSLRGSVFLIRSFLVVPLHPELHVQNIFSVKKDHKICQETGLIALLLTMSTFFFKIFPMTANDGWRLSCLRPKRGQIFFPGGLVV